MDWSDRIGRRIKLRDLHILMRLPTTGSMAKAAAKLRISHPAVSKAISEIEGTLGVRLFDRGSQGAELTAHGEVLLRCGINVFDEMRQGLRSLEHLSDPNSGEVRLGCTEIILHSLVPTIVRRFSEKFPGVQLDVKLTNPGEHQIRELRERKIDLLITRATGRQDDFNSEILFDEPFVFIVGARSEFAQKRRIALKDVLNGNWSCHPTTAPRAHSLPACSGPMASCRQSRSVKTVSVQLTASLIASGEFVGILPTSVAALERSSGRLEGSCRSILRASHFGPRSYT